MKKVFKKAALAVALAGSVFAANATPVIGLFNLTFGLVEVSLGLVDWNNGVGVAPYYNPGAHPIAGGRTYGQFTLPPLANTGSFAGLGGSTGVIQDLSGIPGDADFVPIGAGLTPGFMQLILRPNWLFTETFLSPGTFAGTPYILTELGGNVSATISASGTICDDANLNGVCGVGESVTKWTGIYSAQYTNTSIAQLAAQINAPGGRLGNNTWSGTVEATAIPEPESIALFGLALLGLAAVRRRAVK